MNYFPRAILIALLLLSCTRDREQPEPQINVSKSPFEVLKKHLAENPNDADAWYRLADMYESSQMYNEVVAALTKVISLKPDRRYAYVRLGNAYNRLGKHQDAIKTFLAGANYPPPDPVLYNNLAVSYGMVGKTRDEISALNKAIALRPHYAAARFNLGITLLKTGQRQAALDQYNQLSTFDAGAAASLKKEIDSAGKQK